MKFLSNLMSLLVSSGRLVLMLPSLIIIFGLITFFFFPGIWNAGVKMVIKRALTSSVSSTAPAVPGVPETEPVTESEIVPPVVPENQPRPPVRSYLLVLAFTLAWPLVTIPLMRMVVKMERNGVNLALLVGLAAIPAGLMLSVVWPGMGSMLTLAGFLLYTVAAFLWTGVIMNRVAEG